MAAIYSAFGDESLDGKRTIFAVAAIIGDQQQWDNLSKAWFSATRGIDFHASDCESGHRDFEGYPERERQILYRNLTMLLCDSTLIGYGIAISVVAHNREFPGNLRKNVANSPYLLCFSHVVMECAETARVLMPPGKVHFTFDRNDENKGTATFMYDCYTKSEWVRSHEYLDGEISFASREGKAPIQAADLVARETMKQFERELSGLSGKRLSMEALLRAHRFVFKYLRDADFGELGRQADALGGGKDGPLRKEYEAWLAKHRCPDTSINRMRFRMLQLNKTELVLS